MRCKKNLILLSGNFILKEKCNNPKLAKHNIYMLVLLEQQKHISCFLIYFQTEQKFNLTVHIKFFVLTFSSVFKNQISPLEDGEG